MTDATDAVAFIREHDRMQCDDYVLGLALKAEQHKRDYRIVVMALAASTVLNVGMILWRVL